MYEAFQKEADRDGFTIDRDALIPRFIEVQREIQRGSYELYAEVLRRTAVRVASELGWELEPSRSNFLPNSVPSWAPFRETNAQLERFAKKYELGILVEHRRQAARGHPAPLPGGLRPRRDRPAGAELQARSGSLQGVRAPDRQAEAELGAHRLGLSDRRGALPQVEDPGDLGEPPRRGPRGAQEAGRRGQDLPRRRQAAARPLESRLGSPRRPRHHQPDVADQRRRAARGRRGDARRLALLPGRARGAARRCSRAPASSRTRCSPRTPTSTTCSAGSRSRGWRSGWGSRACSGCTRSPARRSAPCATTTRSSTSSGPRRWRSARCRRLPVPGSVELGAGGARAASRPTATPPTAWR